MRMHRGFARFLHHALVAALPVAGLLVTKNAAAVTTIACIGEQTTSSTDDGPVTNCWPGQLATLLGASYNVGNDVVVNNVGSNGNTVTAGNCVTAASKAGPPNIVIIGPFAEHDYAAGITEATWQADYLKVVEEYLALTPPPTIYVMTPPPAAFVYQSAAEQTFATTVVQPAVVAVAAAKNLKVIDLFSDTALGGAADMGGDGHFSTAGALEVAKLAEAVITGGATTGGSGASTGTSGTSSGTATTGTSAGTGTATTGTTAGTGTATTGTSAGTGTATTGTTTTTGTSEPTSGATQATAGSSPSSTSGTGTSGTGTTPTSGSTTASTGSTAPTSGTGTESDTTGTPKNSSGCTLGPAGSSSAAAGLLSLLGLALVVSRKRGARRS